MEDILLSQKQYQALMTRLDNIKSDVKGLTLKTDQETAFYRQLRIIKVIKGDYSFPSTVAKKVVVCLI